MPISIEAIRISNACEMAPISRGAISEPIKLMLDRMVSAILIGVFKYDYLMPHQRQAIRRR